LICILHPKGLNWFYEAVAQAVHEDLEAEGIPAQLITAPELVAIPPDELGAGNDLLIINFFEAAQSLILPGFAGYCREQFEQLRERVSVFDRRILVNLDSIYTKWFRAHIPTCQAVLTEIFDLTMLPQTNCGMLAGVKYTWLPECLTMAQDLAVPKYDDDKLFPWAMIGHATAPRAVVASELIHGLGPSGFLFLLGLRPSRGDGTRNLTPAELFRVLSHTRYYVWSSHHGYPYHEGLRALNAICNGAVPVKIEKGFAHELAAIPWVYPDVDSFLHAVEDLGPAVMFERAVSFVRSRGTFGRAIATALGIPVRSNTALPVQLAAPALST
jgi:hypothetical protein